MAKKPTKIKSVVSTKNAQFKMYLTLEWEQRLRDAAYELNLRSSQELIQDVLDHYFELYVKVRKSVDEAVRRHCISVTDEVINDSIEDVGDVSARFQRGSRR